MNNSGDIEQQLTPEMALLVTCARSNLSKEHKQAVIRLLGGKLDWDSVIDSAIYHKVLPLLHRSLSSYFKANVPDLVLERTSIFLKIWSLQALRLSSSLINVTRFLGENNIQVLPVKGGLLAEKLYGSANMRIYGDVDILIHQRDLNQALDLLQTNDYTLLPEGIGKSTFLKFLKYYHHGRLLDKNGVLIELHWELSGFYTPAPMTLESLQPFLTKTTFNNCVTFDLTNEMLFIFLCLHSNKHSFTKLDYINSIAELIYGDHALDWDVIVDLGKKYKMIKRILVSLVLVKNIFGVELPENVNDLLKNNPSTIQLAAKIIESEITDQKNANKAHPIKKMILYQPRVMDNKFGAAKFLARSLVVPEHEIWHPPGLPDALFFLYFFYKPYRALTMPIRKIFST